MIRRTLSQLTTLYPRSTCSRRSSSIRSTAGLGKYLSCVVTVGALLIGSITAGTGTVRAETPRRPAPSFEVTATDGKKYSNESLKGKIVVLEWFNPGCPFVKRVYENGYIPGLQKEAINAGAIWLKVNSTNSEHGDFVPLDRVPTVLSEWKSAPTSYILDDTGSLGKLFDAKTTPTVVVIDPNGNVAYMGAVDNYPQISSDEDELTLFAQDAVRAVIANKPVSRPFVKSYGCSIKYAD